MSNRVRNNEKSLLLSDQENESIFNVLGRGCATLSTAVAQLFLSDGGNTHTWNKKCCGAVCFVKDNPKRSYFIRVYDPLSLQLTWEQELYFHFKYKSPKEFFHTFEAHDCQAGLNFASVDEADKFKQTIHGKLLDRQKKRLDKKKQQDGGVRSASHSTPDKRNIQNSAPPVSFGDTSLNKPIVNTVKETPKSKDKTKGKGKKKITKADISTPTQFRHVGHVGWDPESGLQTEKLDPEMKALFEDIGLSDQSQIDGDTIDFIYDFVDKHGGLKAVREDLARRKLPAVPPPSEDQSHAHISKAPHLPARPKFAAPEPPGRERAPPPPSRPTRPTAVPPPTPRRDGHNSGVTGRNLPPTPPPDVPVPPPPPPPPSSVAPPPPPLKKSSEISTPPPSSGRAGLLDAIVNFKSSALSHVQDQGQEKPVSSSSEAPGGIAAALMDALNKRKPAIQCSDDEDRSSDEMDDDDDDEWDD